MRGCGIACKERHAIQILIDGRKEAEEVTVRRQAKAAYAALMLFSRRWEGYGEGGVSSRDYLQRMPVHGSRTQSGESRG